MSHLIWMTLPQGNVSGRGDRVLKTLRKHGLETQTTVALVNDGADGVSPSNTQATHYDAISSLDNGSGCEDIGWRARAGAASLVIGPFTIGHRRGLVLQFQQSDFAELDSAVREGQLLDLIAEVRETCDAREVIWARDMNARDLIEMLESDGSELDHGDLDHIAAVAEVGEVLTEFMELVGSTRVVGGLTFVARRWALLEK